MFVTILYIYMVYVRPDNQYHVLTPVLTLRGGNQITIETESERVRDYTKVNQRCIYAIHIIKSYYTSEVSKCSV